MAHVGQFRRGDYPLGTHDPYSFSGLARHLAALGDDTPNAIRLYVPRLASGLWAMMLYDTGLTWGAIETKPFTAYTWGDDFVAREFVAQTKKYLGFVPAVHEPIKSDIIFAHMAGATNHAEAERRWAPMQAAINRARNATGTPAPNDPTVGRPRAWEEAAPPPPPPNGAPQPPAPPAGRGSIWELLAGGALVVGGIVLL